MNAETGVRARKMYRSHTKSSFSNKGSPETEKVFEVQRAFQSDHRNFKVGQTD